MTALAADLSVDKLTVSFPVGRHGLFNRSSAKWLTAVSDVSLVIPAGTSLGVVGESGCGKSTLARTVAGLIDPTFGSVKLGGSQLAAHRSRRDARRIQMVFQDPASSLNPRITVRNMLTEVLTVHQIVPSERLPSHLDELMRLVGLPTSILDQKPKSLSGGQRQRVGIVRALAPEPELMILDEAIAALDVSVQAAVLSLLVDLRERLSLSMMFISHDLGAVRSVCDSVAVMYLGRIVEFGPVESVLRNPRHPYTRALLDAEPSLDAPKTPGTSGLRGEPPSAINMPVGCAFRARCSYADDTCAESVPVIDMTASHDQACFHPLGTGTAPRDRSTTMEGWTP